MRACTLYQWYQPIRHIFANALFVYFSGRPYRQVAYLYDRVRHPPLRDLTVEKRNYLAVADRLTNLRLYDQHRSFIPAGMRDTDYCCKVNRGMR